MLLRRALLVFALCLSAVIAAGCTTPNRPADRPLHTRFEDTDYGPYDALAELMLALDRLAVDAAGLRAEDWLVRSYTGGRSVENRPLEYLVLGQGRDVTLILATIHGNEPAGTPLVLQLARHLREHPLMLWGRTVVLVPVANPDGKARNRRFNANGVDLNRNFPTAGIAGSMDTDHFPSRRHVSFTCSSVNTILIELSAFTSH
jgi:murein tripeptide amidase MpaA